MSLRSHLQSLDEQQKLIHITKPISKTYEIAGVLKKLEPAPVIFEHVKESPFPVVGNLFCDKASFAAYFGIPINQIIPTLTRAIDQHKPCEVVSSAPCQEVIDLSPNLDQLPILRHCANDGGNYISSGVMIDLFGFLGANISLFTQVCATLRKALTYALSGIGADAIFLQRGGHAQRAEELRR